METGLGSVEAVAHGGAGVEADAVDLQSIGTMRVAGENGIHAILLEERQVPRTRLLAEVEIVLRPIARLANHGAVNEHERVTSLLSLA